MEFKTMIGDSVDFSRKFKKVHYEIEYLELKIHKKTGLIFTSHVYSVEELLKSEHHEKIDSITRKIGDDAKNWFKAEKLSTQDLGSYYKERDKVDEALHKVNKEIEKREPTWWESVCDSFTEFIKVIMKNMPDLVRGLIGKAINKLGLPSPIRKILGLPSLPRNRD